MKLPFVDAHAHFWDLSGPGYDWLRPPFSNDVPGGSPEAIATTYLLDDYLAETAKWLVAGIVHVEAGAGAGQALAETERLEELATRRSLPSGLVAGAALDAPDIEAQLEAHVAASHVRGIRDILNWHPNPALSYTPRDRSVDPVWRRGFAALERFGLSFDAHAYPGQFEALAELFGQHEAIPVIVDHLGMPILNDPDGLAVWRSGLQRLAAHPHVAVKLSGAGFMGMPWTSDIVKDVVRTAIDIFSPQRVLIATNFPTDRLFDTLDNTLAAYNVMTADYSEDECRDMWGRNADRIYRLELGL